MNITESVRAVLRGDIPDQIPFISRMDFWQRGLKRQGRTPEAYRGMSLSEVHQATGLGLEEWMSPFTYKYRELELVVSSAEGEIQHEYEPEISFFPDLWGIIPVEQPGELTTDFITPKGRLTTQHRITAESIHSGTTRPQMTEHPIREPADFEIYEFMLERAEFVPRFEDFYRRAEELEGLGFLVPTLNRVPFQSLLIDAVGEIPLFYALYDAPELVERLLDVIDRQVSDLLGQLEGFDYPYVEFIDNLDGWMTNPRLFQKHVAPSYRRYAEILHRQGKKLGSHTDGDMKALLSLLPESGLDVCESFTPAPMTGCTFEEAWEAWGRGPLIWGGIPSYYLEERVEEAELQQYFKRLLKIVKGKPIILGISDAVMANNQIERVEWIASRLEDR